MEMRGMLGLNMLEPHIWTHKYADTDQQISYGNYSDGAV